MDAPKHPAAPTYSPLVRHDAERRHVDLTHLRGSGPGGLVTRNDVAGRPAGPLGGEPTARPLAALAAEPAGPVSRTRSSPLARRLAADAGLALATLVGSGPGGAIVARDVACPPARSEPGAATPARHRPAPACRSGSGGPSAILMARSKREIPHYYLATDVDCAPALAWLAGRNEALGRRPDPPSGAAAQGDRAGGTRRPRPQRLLGRRGAASAAPTSTSAWRSRCATAAWSCRRSTAPTGCPSAISWPP